MTDHYAALGVSRDASADEIKRAYRRLARELHPDANPDDPSAAERFKEVSHSYEVLSDPAKRRRYDMFGDDRAQAGGFSDFGGISDLFSTFFGGGGFGGEGRSDGRRGPARGSDVVAEVELTLEEAAVGVRRDVEVSTLAECSECGGSGAAPGTFPSSCSECGGVGEVREVRRTMLGNVMTASTCARCRGAGEEITDPCKQCRGARRVSVTESHTVEIPAGIDEGAQLRLSGRGAAGVRGGGAGDLYVVVNVSEHPVFRRVGDDLGCEVEVPMTVAALGGTVEVPGLDGLDEPHDIEVQPGTQPGEIVRLKGRGMPRLGGRGRGELVVLLKVETPRDLTHEEVEILHRFAELRGEHTGAPNLFDKIKGAFR